MDEVNRMTIDRLAHVFSNSRAYLHGHYSREFLTDLSALVELLKLRARTIHECITMMERFPVSGLGPYRAPQFDAGFIDASCAHGRANRYAAKLRELGVDPDEVG